jgi:hypothetical protein
MQDASRRQLLINRGPAWPSGATAFLLSDIAGLLGLIYLEAIDIIVELEG